MNSHGVTFSIGFEMFPAHTPTKIVFRLHIIFWGYFFILLHKFFSL